jgi:hypothetical protein
VSQGKLLNALKVKAGSKAFFVMMPVVEQISAGAFGLCFWREDS